MSPTYEVEILDFNNETQKVKLATLTAWKHALNLETKGITVIDPPCSVIVREFLSAPSSYPLDVLALYIQTSLRGIQRHLEIEA